MSKDKIPVYNICSLSKDKKVKQNDLLLERFGAYLNRHEHSLHHSQRHSFFHLVLFTKGSGTYTIDFTTFKDTPYEIYFMIPGQVHSWHFKGDVYGYIINFSDALSRSFLLNPNYLNCFHFFRRVSEESVCQLPIKVQGKVYHLLEEILTSTSNSIDGEIDMIRLLLMQLFLIVKGSCTGNNRKIIPQQKQVLLRNFGRLIDQHYLSIKLPKEYADLLYVTPNHPMLYARIYR